MFFFFYISFFSFFFLARASSSEFGVSYVEQLLRMFPFRSGSTFGFIDAAPGSIIVRIEVESKSACQELQAFDVSQLDPLQFDLTSTITDVQCEETELEDSTGTGIHTHAHIIYICVYISVYIRCIRWAINLLVPFLARSEYRQNVWSYY